MTIAVTMTMNARDCSSGGHSTHLTTPAEATLTKGTRRPRSCFAVGETRRRGTSRVRDTASATDVAVAAT
jgi:hypothetical protein